MRKFAQLSKTISMILASIWTLNPAIAATPAPAPALPKLFDVPAFELKDQAAKSISLSTLKGKIWVADFIYTSCDDECPLMTRTMKTIQNTFPGSKDVVFVSITTDPKRDTPAKLKAYAKIHKVDEANWYFLTGDKKAIVSLSMEGFKLTANEKSVAHTGKFALVDRAGKIRGYYESTDKQAMAKLVTDIKTLSSPGAQ